MSVYLRYRKAQAVTISVVSFRKFKQCMFKTHSYYWYILRNIVEGTLYPEQVIFQRKILFVQIRLK
jgi:hypothetical protein